MCQHLCRRGRQYHDLFLVRHHHVVIAAIVVIVIVNILFVTVHDEKLYAQIAQNTHKIDERTFDGYVVQPRSRCIYTEAQRAITCQSRATCPKSP